MGGPAFAATMGLPTAVQGGNRFLRLLNGSESLAQGTANVSGFRDRLCSVGRKSIKGSSRRSAKHGHDNWSAVANYRQLGHLQYSFQ